MTPTRAVFFDFAGTLFSDRDLRDAHLAQLRFVAGAVGAAPDDRQLRTAYRAGLSRAYTTVAVRSSYRHEELFGLAFTETARQLGGTLPIELARQAVERQYRATFDHAALRSDCSATLAALRSRGLHLHLVSNMDNVQLSPLVDKLGLSEAFDAVTSSEDAGSCKPDEGIYRTALVRAGCGASAVLFVGDSLGHDVYGPARLGMRTAWLAPPGRRPDPGPVEPDHVIGSLGEVVDLVGRAPADKREQR